MAKVQVYGKVVERTCSTYKDTQYYHIVLEEQTQYPSRFRFTTKDPTLCGPKDGFAAIGRMVTATAFVNSREVEVERKDGNGKFKSYRVSFTLTDLADCSASNAKPAATQSAPASSDGDDDIPY